MTITWSLTVVAFILIFVELGGWTSLHVTDNPHAVIGVVTTVLAFIQPFMAYFRPHPGTPKRFIFNWAHWLVGNSAHILASMFFFKSAVTFCFSVKISFSLSNCSRLHLFGRRFEQSWNSLLGQLASRFLCGHSRHQSPRPIGKFYNNPRPVTF